MAAPRPESPYRRATALLAAGRGDEAVAVMQAAYEALPHQPEIRARLALVCWEADHLDDAREHAVAVLAADPDNASALAARGLVAYARGYYADACVDLDRATAARPDFVAAHVYAGLARAALGDDDAALAALDRALFLRPGHANARFSRALQWLRRGWYDRGWPEYEWRWATGQLQRPDIPRPRWDGRPLAGRRILVHGEQGIGDSLQFVRFLPRLAEQGAHVVFACKESLRPLFERTPGIDEWFPIDRPAPPDFDVYTPIGSLPGLLGIDETTMAAEIPYVFPDPMRVDAWRSRVTGLPGLRVGVAWQGSPTFLGDHLRSIPLRHFAPLAIDGVTLVSLQKGFGEEQVAEVAATVPLTVLDGLDADGATMMDTAAVMQHLDLVITSDTAIAHLGGSMGVPTWVALAYSPDWRWQRVRVDSPWYPSLRLFRQPAFADWEGVFAAMAGALRERIAGVPDPGAAPAGAPAVTVPVSPGELFDRITILRIKAARVVDAEPRAHVTRQLESLERVAAAAYRSAPELTRLVAELRAINEALWDVEDAVRRCEAAGDFGPDFVALARSVYLTNDRRFATKAAIDAHLGTAFSEVKSYAGP